MNPQSSFGYNGAKFSVVNDDCICYISANSVCVWNTSIGKKDYLISKKNGYTACTANYMKGFIAAAEYGLNPDVHIYKYPGNQLVAKIKAETTIQCIDLAFSRDCTRLLMIGDKPDYKISIYNIEEKRMLTIKETLKDKNYLTAAFNPADPDQFFVASPHNLTFYTIIGNSYTITKENGESSISKSERVNSMIFAPENPETIYKDIIWDPYSKLYIATDQNVVHQIDFNTGEEKMKLNLEEAPRALILTQRHLIVAIDNNKVLWYSALPPEERVTQQILQKDKLIQLQDEIMQEYLFENGGIQHMAYTRNFKKIVFGCQDGFLATLSVEAEVYNEEEEEEDEDGAKEVKTINTPLSELGKFHTRAINGIKELGETTQVVTVSDDHFFCIWEATTGACLARENLHCKLTALAASTDGNKIFIGSEGGVVRIYDVSNRCLPRLIKLHRFFYTAVHKIVISHDDRIIAVSSKESKEVCFFYQAEKNEFQFMCFIEAKAKVIDICWSFKDKELRLLGLTENFLLFSERISIGGVENLRKPLPDDVSFPMYNKVDIDCYSVDSDPFTGDVYVVGKDKYLKKYEMPKHKYEELNFEKPPSPPLEEFKSHGVATTCFDYSEEADFMASGGKDGILILRNRKKLNQFSEIKAHAVFNGGIKAICFSRKRTTLYSAGGDGSFLVWPVGAKPNPSQAIEPADFFSSPDLSNIPTVDNVDDESVKYYKELLEEQFLDSEIPRKEEFKVYLSKELKTLQTKLYELLEENKKAQDIEQLERDEFVIDVDKKKELETKAEEEREQIRKEAKRKELEYECLKERVKNETWDKMETNSTACIALNSDLLLYNYGIRKRTNVEVKRLKQILNFRRMELREELTGMEKRLDKILDQDLFSKGGEKYIMDRDKGEQKYEQDDEAPVITQVKSPTKRKKDNKRDNNEETAGMDGQNKGKRKPKVDLNQFRLGANKPKMMDDDDFEDKLKDRQVNRDEANIEELKWKIITKKKELEDLREDLYKLGTWDLIYEPFELYTDSRKRMQIEMLQDVVFKLKEEYNKEFVEFQKLKDDQIFTIQEKNGRIKEILEDLKRDTEFFHPRTHLQETPEHILSVSESEVPVEKHLTAEEQAIEAEKRRIEEERLKALEGDNVGQRGIKTMLGGTLEMKKNKGIMEETLEREEWMDKPIEDMTEEEKLKLKEFQQKEKELQEEKDKKIKAWDQELKKLRLEIDEIGYKFEDQLKILHKKRLFYDMRVYEQELYIIRLTLMLHENKEIKEEEKIIAEKKTKVEAELEEARYTITRFTEMYDDFDNRYRENTAIIDQEKTLKQKFPANNRAILNFVKNGGKAANRAQGFGVNQEKNVKEQEMLSHLCAYDPYTIIDANLIKKKFADDNAKEHYTFERDNIQGLSPEEFDQLVEERMHRIEMNKQRDEMEQEINHIKNHKDFCEFNSAELEEAFEEIKESHTEIVNRMVKLKYNFELIVYLLQGQVEVPQAPVATDYKDAILIKTKVIENENKEVALRGDKNVDKLEKITQFKKNLYHETWKNDKLKLEIKDLTERAIDVQLYKVKKETQEIIKGNHRTKDEEEKKRLDDQINNLLENAKARIEVLSKKKKKLKNEINEKRKENNELETRARELQRNVDQRKQIMELRSKGNDDGVQDPTKKFKEIANIRKYREIVEQQKEEIEFLEDELERFRSKTFPSFANMHTRQDYAD